MCCIIKDSNIRHNVTYDSKTIIVVENINHIRNKAMQSLQSSRSRPPRRSRRPLRQALLIVDPVVSIRGRRVDKLGHDFEIGLYDEDGSSVLVLLAVIGRRK